MAVQGRADIDTTRFVLSTAPAYREDNAVIEQDAGRAAVLAQYTVMAEKPVTIPTTMTADGGNTGDGTVTAVVAAAGGVPVVGSWELENVEAIADGGVFKLTDPNGNVIASNLVLNVGAGNTTTFTVAGLVFTVTDGATNFALADKFTLAVTVNGKSVPFDATAADGSEIVTGIFMGEDIAAATIVAGDVEQNPVIFTGIVFDAAKLVFDNGADTLDTVLSTGKTIRDTLRALDLIPTITHVDSAQENV